MTYDNSNNLTAPAVSTNVQPELWRLPKVCKFVGLSKSTIYQMIQNKKFPAPLKIGARAVAWRADIITKWIQDRPLSM
ncbi:helix-turn-helix transcriptional regulator [Methylovulum psychrotolerans]|jgi:prophage regulatory protein|uniref:AlpA family transcriptional regulator n=1 Tax=Methylovulum psychrotolerans TaxID=1704499 RepID=A0A1Z4BW11_9GAMM|nr:AlpA family transcriptional regulator [Methylovulum psychrotolerans]